MKSECFAFIVLMSVIRVIEYVVYAMALPVGCYLFYVMSCLSIASPEGERIEAYEDVIDALDKALSALYDPQEVSDLLNRYRPSSSVQNDEHV